MSPSTNPLAYTPCQVPLRRAIGVFGGNSITVHAGCYYDVLEADRRWREAGGNELWDVRQQDTGSYNCRPSAGHSRAVAIDFNWNCLSADTLVWTREGLIPIADLAGTEPEILTRDLVRGGGGRWVRAPIASFGLREVFDVVLSHGDAQLRIGATADHRWFRAENPETAPRYRRTVESLTTDLVPGAALVMCKPPPQAFRTTVSPVGVAAGLTFGDGSYDRNRGSVVHLFGEDLGELLDFFARPNIRSNPTTNGVPGVSVFGLPGSWKRLPPLEESASYLLGWLAGYFAADGHVSLQGQASLTSARREHLEFYRLVAARCGIACGAIREGKAGTYDSGHSTRYSMSLIAATVPNAFFVRRKHLNRFTVVEHRDSQHWIVEDVLPRGHEETYCAVVDGTGAFTLDGWLLTGNSNGMTRKQTPCPGDMPAAFYEICWRPLGYGWGANWRSKCDRMHISKLISEGGDGVLYRKWSPPEEEEFLAKLTEEEQQRILYQSDRAYKALWDEKGGKEINVIDEMKKALIRIETKLNEGSV